jgi:tetratricopeptide (TPR) repeat protein
MAPAHHSIQSLLQDGRWETLRIRLDEGVTAARPLGDPKGLAEHLALRSVVHAVLGHQKSALQDAEEALKIQKRLHLSLDAARALAGLAAIKCEQEGPRAALELLKASMEAYRPHEEVAERCHAALGLSGLQLSQGRTREARDVADEGITWCVDDTLAWCKWTLLEVKADTFEVDQDYMQALTFREQAFLLRQRENAVSSSALCSIAELYRYLGRIWEAEQMLGMARDYAREETGASNSSHLSIQAMERPTAKSTRQGRLTLPGLRLPGWERSH